MKRATIRQAIRDFVSASDAPVWRSEIIAATGCDRKRIHDMVKEGMLVRHSDGPVLAYSIGKLPRVAMTKEQRAEAVKESWRRQYARKQDARAAAKAAQQPTVKRAPIRHVAPTTHAACETLAEYLARGGKVEVCPGMKPDYRFAQRCPQMGNYRSMTI